jgi:hypothetical protein
MNQPRISAHRRIDLASERLTKTFGRTGLLLFSRARERRRRYAQAGYIAETVLANRTSRSRGTPEGFCETISILHLSPAGCHTRISVPSKDHK